MRHHSNRPDVLALAGTALCAVFAGFSVGVMSSDTARQAAPSARTFNPALLCRAQTTAVLKARAAQLDTGGTQ